MSQPPDDKPYWLDRPANVSKLIRLLLTACGLLLLVEPFYHKHVEFGFEGWFGFFAWYGFLAYCFVVLVAKRLRRWLRRAEDYYD